MVHPIYAYGHDYGNSETCGIVGLPDGTQQVLVLPSTLYAGRYEELAQKVAGSSSSSGLMTILSPTAHTIALNGKQWFVGDLAIGQAPGSTDIAALTSRGDISRYWSDRSLALLLATSGALIPESEYGLYVVTNLPIATHNENNVHLVKFALSGDHEFVLDGRPRLAHVRVMKTIMEGAGANIAYGPGGQEKVGVIDIGGRTTDAYMVTGQLPITEQCKSLDTGVESAIDAIIPAFEERFRYPLSLIDARSLFHHYTRSKDYETVATVQNVEASSAEIDALLDEQLRTTGGKIAAFVKRIWSSSLSRDVVASDVTTILLVGGGAHFFAKDIRPLFKKRLMVPGNPEYANAAGYYKLARHFSQREQQRAGQLAG